MSKLLKGLPRLIVLGVSLSLLTGCETPGGSCKLLSLVEYSEEFENKLANELEPLAENSAVVRSTLDYHDLRNKVRECAA